METGAWIDTDASISGGIDSYYEYLWKCWRLFGDEDCHAMWNASLPAVNRYLADDVGGQLWYGHADMDTGMRKATEYGALDAYFPAVLALSGDIGRASRLQDSSFRMWNLYGIEPEVLDYRAMKARVVGIRTADLRSSSRPTISITTPTTRNTWRWVEPCSPIS